VCCSYDFVSLPTETYDLVSLLGASVYMLLMALVDVVQIEVDLLSFMTEVDLLSFDTEYDSDPFEPDPDDPYDDPELPYDDDDPEDP
jgi:hypothetical protein